MAAERSTPTPAIVPVHGVSYSPLTGRCRIVGSGVEVFEVVKAFRALGENWARLRRAFHWLSEAQLQAALEFYRLNPALVQARLALEDEAHTKALWEKYLETVLPPR